MTTEALKGTETKIVQGFIPHHYRTTKLGFEFTGMEYICPRGKIKTAIGNSFDITYPFIGILPVPPAPQKTGLANDYDPSPDEGVPGQVRHARQAHQGRHLLGRQGTAAVGPVHEHRRPDERPHRRAAQGAPEGGPLGLADLHARGRDKRHDRIFFYYYPNYKGLVGWHEEFWSYQFTDHHFHYGYFTMAGAPAGPPGPAVAEGLRPDDHAWWPRNTPTGTTTTSGSRSSAPSTCGKATAGRGGHGPNNGPDEESSSEAVQSWGGLFLLGAALGDEDMMAAGAMGWCCESQAAQEYWFNKYGDDWSPNFQKPMVGMVFAAGHAYANYFTGDMAWTYGIQLMPNSPALQYFAQDPAFCKKHWEKMMKMTRKTADPGCRHHRQDGLRASGNVMLSHAVYFDPDWTVKTIADLMASHSEVVDPLAEDNGVPAPGGLVVLQRLLAALAGARRSSTTTPACR